MNQRSRKIALSKKRDIALLIDEAYVEFAPGDCLELVKKYNNLFISELFQRHGVQPVVVWDI